MWREVVSALRKKSSVSLRGIGVRSKEKGTSAASSLQISHTPVMVGKCLF